MYQFLVWALQLHQEIVWSRSSRIRPQPLAFLSVLLYDVARHNTYGAVMGATEKGVLGVRAS